jgi:SDR family mycofactocin-dependent oxidoreductase
MGRLDGKVAFITGGARGQGRSHAVMMAKEGADILTVDLCDQIETVEYPTATPADLAETVRLVEAEGRRIIARQADVRDFAKIKAVVADGYRDLGSLDIVVANAGIMPVTGDVSHEAQAFYDAVDVMLTGVYHTCQAAIPLMVDQDAGGAIIIISSVSGLRGFPGNPKRGGSGVLGYTAAKHGVVGLMRAYASALAEYRIRCNSIHPTGVNSPMSDNEPFRRLVEAEPEMAARLANPLPVPVIECVDVSNAVVFLASDEGRYITGITLPVDAGFCNK